MTKLTEIDEDDILRRMECAAEAAGFIQSAVHLLHVAKKHGHDSVEAAATLCLRAISSLQEAAEGFSLPDEIDD